MPNELLNGLVEKRDILTRNTTGTEAECWLVDENSLMPSARLGTLREQLSPDEQRQLHDEILTCQLEGVTNPVAWIANLHRQLIAQWERMRRQAESLHCGILWSGVHPFWNYDSAFIRPGARSDYILQRCGSRLRQFAVTGVHIHVWVEPRQRVPLLNRLAGIAPLLTALTANSPIVGGRLTGLRSQRADWWGHGLPASGFPPHFTDEAHFQAHIDELYADGVIQFDKDLYWPIRLTRYGTLEFRTMDTPSDMEHVALLAALLQCLTVAASSSFEFNAVQPFLDHSPAVCHSNQLAAAADGPDARLLIPGTGDMPVRDIVLQLVQALRPIARDLACIDYLDGVNRLPDENGSSFQLKVFAETGSAVDVTRALLERNQI